MSYIIIKIGGSNLRQQTDISRIIEAIRQYRQPVIIVVSAFYGLTDRLIQSYNDAQNGMDVANALFAEIRQLKMNAASAQLHNPAQKSSYLKELDHLLQEMQELLFQATIKGVSAERYDHFLSYGERLSALFFSYVLHHHGFHAQLALPEDFGLITDGEPGNSTVNIEQSTQNLNKWFNTETYYVVPGFYGVSPKGTINLLGRGGSDYSAAAIGACLNAKSVDLWKDVQGFCTADPKLVASAKSIERLSYAEAAELAYFGTKIIHPRAIEPLSDKAIPLRIFHLHQAGEFQVQTIINGSSPIVQGGIKSVGYSDHFGILALEGEGVGLKPGVLGRASTALEQAGINIKSVFTSQTAINFLLDLPDLSKAVDALHLAKLSGVHHISSTHDVSLIAAVGNGLKETSGIAAQLFSAAAASYVNIQTIVFGASRVAMYFIVDRKDRDKTIRQIHAAFFDHFDAFQKVNQ